MQKRLIILPDFYLLTSSTIIFQQSLHMYINPAVLKDQNLEDTVYMTQFKFSLPFKWNICLFELRFCSPVNPMGHVERGQFT